MGAKQFFQKNKGNLMIVVIILLLFIPQTGMPIKVFFSRLVSFSPSEIAVEDRVLLDTYDWQLASTQGALANLSASEGNVVLINFWATWCPPCVAEMPSLQNLYDEYGDRVDFYFVSMESEEKINKFMEKKGYNFPVYIPKQQIPQTIRGNSLPTTYVISKKGGIVVDKVGAADWDSRATKELLNGLLAD